MHTFIGAAVFLSLAVVLRLTFGTLFAGDDYLPPDRGDLDTGSALDLATGHPHSGTFNPGLLLITTGENGATNVAITGNSGDEFGYSVAVIGDIDNDGFDDVLIGAPNATTTSGGTGAIYLFLGPFDTPSPTQLSANDADAVLPAWDITITRFGSRVGPLADFNNDGIVDLRILAEQIQPDSTTVKMTYILSGADATPLYEITGYSPFDPWLVTAGDANGDSLVDFSDIEHISRNLGAEGPELTAADGDVNGDSIVDNTDKQFVPVEVIFENVPLDGTTIEIEYSASDPGGVTQSLDDPFILPPGLARLWHATAGSPRDVRSLQDGGDFVAPGVYTPQELGIIAASTSITLWLEAVRRSGVDELTLRVQVHSQDGTIEHTDATTSAEVTLFGRGRDDMEFFEIGGLIGTMLDDPNDPPTPPHLTPGSWMTFALKVDDARGLPLTEVVIEGQSLPLSQDGTVYQTPEFMCLPHDTPQGANIPPYPIVWLDGDDQAVGE
ncbi:MAG: hypothetical protein ACR2GY_06600 [Phycisphaerales bacterium]